MCGISGVLVSPSDLARIQVDEAMSILMREMESRGREATGIARLTASDRIRLTKNACSASMFLAKHPGIGAGCRLVISHTRLPTQGDKSDNANNHPIVCGDIIGVHNGSVRNDYSLYREHGWKRVGKVDSEVIFAAINHLGALPAMEVLEGAIAAAWMDKTDMGALWIARHSSSPLNVGITEGGSVIFASTNAAVAKAAVLFPGGITIDTIKEGVVLRFAHNAAGELEHGISEFTPPSSYSYGGSSAPGGFRRNTTPRANVAPSTPSGNVLPIGGSTASSRPSSAAQPSWVVGGGGYVIKPNDQVVFVPVDEEYADFFGTFVDTSYKAGYAYVRLLLDFGVTDEVSLPVKQLFPLSVWREGSNKIPDKGSFSARFEKVQDEADEDVEDPTLLIINEMSDDQSPRAEQFWNAIMQAESDDDEVLANALVLAYDAGMEIAEWINAAGDIEAPESMVEAIRATVVPSRDLPALPPACQWDDVIDVEEVQEDGNVGADC